MTEVSKDQYHQMYQGFHDIATRLLHKYLDFQGHNIPQVSLQLLDDRISDTRVKRLIEGHGLGCCKWTQLSDM